MRILVLGATGNVGPHVVRALLARGPEVRVLTRDPERARTRLPAEVHLVQGNALDDEDVRSAADGVDSVFLLSPHSHDLTDLELRVIRTLRRTGTRIVKLSATSSAIHPDGPYTLRQHWEIEQVLAASGQPFVILRPNAFMQTLIDQIMLPALAETRAIPNPIGPAGVSLIDAQDIGEVAAAALTDDAFNGQTLVLTGPRAVTYPDIANLISTETGTAVPLREVTPHDVRTNLLHRGMHAWEAEHFEEMYQLFRDGRSAFVTDTVERVLGRPPRTVEAYLHDHRDRIAQIHQQQTAKAP